MSEPVFVRAADVPTAEFDDQLAVMDLKSGTYIAFNRTAAAVWKLLDEPRTLAAICAELAPVFRVAPEQCRSDVAELLDQLCAMQVVNQTVA